MAKAWLLPRALVDVRPIVQRPRDRRRSAAPDIRKRFCGAGLEIVGNTPEEFTRFQAQENEALGSD